MVPLFIGGLDSLGVMDFVFKVSRRLASVWGRKRGFDYGRCSLMVIACDIVVSLLGGSLEMGCVIPSFCVNLMSVKGRNFFYE